MTELLTPIETETRTKQTEPGLREQTLRRVLVVVDDACTAPGLCPSVRAFTRETPIEAFVITPAHDTPATQWYVDEDAARADATHRLRTCLACLARNGIRANGELSDPDPIEAIDDALHQFPADEIVFVSAPQRPSTWLHQNVIDRARHRFPQLIEHLVLPTPQRASESRC